METMRYQENKKTSKWPIFAFLSFVIIGGALIYIGISNEDEPEKHLCVPVGWRETKVEVVQSAEYYNAKKC